MAVAVKLCNGICQDPEEPERTFGRIDPELAGDLGRGYDEAERCEIFCHFPHLAASSTFPFLEHTVIDQTAREHKKQPKN
jgi:hypothetical protein